MPPKSSSNFNGKMGRGYYKRSANYRHQSRFDPAQDRQAGDNPLAIHQVMRRDGHQQQGDDGCHQQPPASKDMKPTGDNANLPKNDLYANEVDKLRQLVDKLHIEMGLLKERMRNLESSIIPSNSSNDVSNSNHNHNNQNHSSDRKQSETVSRPDTNSKKSFYNKKRRVRMRAAEAKTESSTQDQPHNASQPNETAQTQTDNNSPPTSKPPPRSGADQGRRNSDRNHSRRSRGSGRPNDRHVAMRQNDDSTTQAADHSSEERPDGEERNNDAKERKRVLRRKKNRYNRVPRGSAYANRRRVDSSERNSNDTSPHAVANDDTRLNKSTNEKVASRPPVDTEEIVQNAKRDFLHCDRDLKSIHDELNSYGSTLIREFSVSILDHVICDVTSPTESSEIASRIHSMLFKDNLSKHQESFVNAINNISSREADIAIDAPRYMDSLGQFLAEIIVLGFSKNEENYKSFLLACIEKYRPENRSTLLVSIMTAIAEIKDERYARNLWNKAELEWGNYVPEENLACFMESNSSIKFTTSEILPESSPPDVKILAQRLERFADDITAMVERKKDPQELLDRWTMENENVGIIDQVPYHAHMIYGIIRGSLVLLDPEGDMGAKVDQELLQVYDSILGTHHDKQDDIALSALTLLTKLWSELKCPKDMFISALSALHCTHKTTTITSLRRWLEDGSLQSIPGIGAARLNCKRFIDDVTLPK